MADVLRHLEASWGQLGAMLALQRAILESKAILDRSASWAILGGWGCWGHVRAMLGSWWAMLRSPNIASNTAPTWPQHRSTGYRRVSCTYDGPFWGLVQPRMKPQNIVLVKHVLSAKAIFHAKMADVEAGGGRLVPC